jgi:hypothetical protein
MKLDRNYYTFLQGDSDYDDSHLRMVIIEKATDDIMESTRIMPLEERETNLDQGRFARYVKKKLWRQSVSVQLIHYEDDFSVIGDRIDWIAENLASKWSVYVQSFDSIEIVTFRFCFKYHVDAVHFALRWK